MERLPHGKDIFNNADSALYYAKEHGKNQIAVYNELDIVNKGRDGKLK